MITRENFNISFPRSYEELRSLEDKIEQLLAERDAYKEVAKQFRKDLFDKMRIPYDHDPEIYAEVDAEAARIINKP